MTISAVLLGGECTGKTHLALALAAAMTNSGRSALVVPEELRAFVDENGRTPTKADQQDIWRAQSDAWNSARESGVDLVICDPAPVMTAVYSIQYFDDPSLLESALPETSAADLVIWCRPDITWKPDGPHRDGPQARQATDRLLHDLVIGTFDDHRLHLATGSLTARVDSALEALTPLLP